MKVFKFRIDDGFSKMTLNMIKDSSHFRNMIIVMNKKLREERIKGEDGKYEETIKSSQRFKVLDYKFMRKTFSKLSSDLGCPDIDDDFRTYVMNEFPDMITDIVIFYSKYSNKIFVDVIKEVSKNIKTAIKQTAGTGKTFKLRTKKISEIVNGSINLNSNIVKDKGTFIDIQVFTNIYKKQHGISSNLRIPFNANKILGEDVSIKNVTLSLNSKRETFALVTYDEELFTPIRTGKFSLGIDPGIKNQLTLVSDNPDARSLLIRSRAINRNIKNKQYQLDNLNRAKSKLLKERRFDSEFHFYKNKVIKLNEELRSINMNEINKITSRIIDYCNKFDISTIYFGYNKGQRISPNMGKKNNRRLLSFPMYSLKENLKYKCMLEGIELVEQEESYTSKFSCICEKYPIYNYSYDNNRPSKQIVREQGTRNKRSLFKDRETQLIFNADVNGAYNILQKGKGANEINTEKFKPKFKSKKRDILSFRMIKKNEGVNNYYEYIYNL